MIYTGSIITFENGRKDTALEFISTCPEIEIHAFSDDGGNAVVTIETENDKSLETLSDMIKKHEAVKDIAHHYMYFGEETEKILNGEEVPDISTLFRSGRIKDGENNELA